MNIKFARANKDVKIPSKRTEDAGMDVYAYFTDDYIVIYPHQTRIVKTGIYSIIENGYFVKLMDRSSTGVKGFRTAAGVIDSGYRGEWGVVVTNTTNNVLVICKNMDEDNISGIKKSFGAESIIYPYSKAICQAVVLPVPDVVIDEISIDEVENYKSERGNGCLGSSGK